MNHCIIMIRAVSVERYQMSGIKRAVPIGLRNQLDPGINWTPVSVERYQKSGTRRAVPIVLIPIILSRLNKLPSIDYILS
jgi:hypothetical protein